MLLKSFQNTASNYLKFNNTRRKMATLSSIVSKLNDFAPLSLAESWDNVGLLIEPATPRFVIIIIAIKLNNLHS